MNDTMRKYRDYVMTGFVKQVVPVVFEKASGAVVTDVDGREYLDCFAGISVVNAGHCNPEVIAAAKAQMDKLVHCCSYSLLCPAGCRSGRKAGKPYAGSFAEDLLR